MSCVSLTENLALLKRFGEVGALISVTESDLIDLLNQKSLELEVGTIPYEAKGYLGCARDTVFLSNHSLRHIFENHGEHVSSRDLLLLPEVLTRGLWLSDQKRSNFVIVSCLVVETRFKAVVKTTLDRSRNYISTFHRTAKRQTKSLLKRGRVLRAAW